MVLFFYNMIYVRMYHICYISHSDIAHMVQSDEQIQYILDTGMMCFC